MFLAAQLDQTHPLGIAAHHRDLVGARTDQRAHVADQHQFIALEYLHGAHHVAVAVVGPHGDHALGAAALDREFADARPLAVTVGACREYEAVLARNDERDHPVAPPQADASHTARRAPHGPHIGFLESRGLSRTRGEQHVAMPVGDGGAHQGVALFQNQGDQPARPRTGEMRQLGLLDGSIGRRHEHEVAVVVFPHREQRRHPLVGPKGQQVHQRAALGVAVAAGNHEHPQPVDLAHVGEAQQRVVAVGDEQVLHEILVAHRGRDLAAPAPPLRLVDIEGLGLGVALVGNGHHEVFLGNEVFRGEILLSGEDLGAARVAVSFGKRFEFFADDRLQAFLRPQDILQVGDLVEHGLVVPHQLVLLQGSEAVQAHVEYGLGLGLGEMVDAVAQPEALLQALRPARIAARAGQQVLHALRRPAAAHQGGPGLGGGAGLANQLDHLIDARQRHRLAFEQVPALPGAAQQEQRAPGDHLAPVLDESLQHLLEVQYPGLPVDQRHAVDAEHGLELGLGVEIVEHHIAGLAPAQFDNDAQAVLVGFVAQLGDALDLLLFHQFRDLLDEPRFVELVGNLRDHDDVAAPLLVLDHFGPGAHVDAAPARAVGLHDAGPAVDDSGGGKIRALDVLHEPVDADRRVVEQRQHAGHHFVEIVRRDVGGHAHRDTGTAVDEEIGRPGGQHLRHGQRVVVVGYERHGFLVEIGEQFRGEPVHADFRVAHGRRRVAVHRTEVALAVDEQVAHGEFLGHAHERVVDGQVAVGVVFAHDITHHPGRFHIGACVRVVQLAHGEQHPAVHGFQAVANVRQGTAHNDAHGVVQVGLPQFVFDVYGEDFPRLTGGRVRHLGTCRKGHKFTTNRASKRAPVCTKTALDGRSRPMLDRRRPTVAEPLRR